MPKYGLNRNILKIIAFTSMLIDHFCVAFVQNPWKGYIRGSVGRIAYPIFCWLFFLGFFYVKDYVRHVILLLVAGIASEYFFDVVLFKNNVSLYPTHQNVMFSWLLGFVFLWLLKIISEADLKYKSVTIFLECILMIVFVGITEYTKVDYQSVTIFVFGILFWLKQFVVNVDSIWLSDKIYGIVTVLLIALLKEKGVLLALIPVLLYSSAKCVNKWKYFYYVGYPAHLCIFSIIIFCLRHFHS